MWKLDLLLKIGGSVMTDKRQEGVINTNLLKEISGVVKELYERGLKMVIVTGVGSYGHRAVARHSIHKGDNGTHERRLGLLEAQIDVNILRKAFLEALLEAGVPAMQFYASSIAESNKGRPINFNLAAVGKFLGCGMIPVVSGDVVPDKTMGYSVMSGDIVALEIYKQWSPRILAYGTNVKGVYSDDPDTDPDAELLEVVDSKMLHEALHGVTEGMNVDVSGAMRGKVQAIYALMTLNPTIEAHIFDLREPWNLTRLADNLPFSHTVVKK